MTSSKTYRQLAVLVCKFGLDRQHPAVGAAAGFFLSSFQAGAGDYRGIYGRQYTPNYSAAITELLLRAGYEGSAQVETCAWMDILPRVFDFRFEVYEFAARQIDDLLAEAVADRARKNHTELFALVRHRIDTGMRAFG